MPRFLYDRKLQKTFALLLVTVAVLAGLVVLLWPYFGALGDRDKIAELIADAGSRAPLVFMGLQILQVIVAPIPGQVMGFVGGYLFGTVLGTVYSMIGTTIGFAIVFTLARRLGRPFVEYFVAKHHLEKFDYLASAKGIWVLLIVFFLPILPDAIAGYAAGLTTIKIRTLLLVSFAGRLPSILLLSLAGSKAANADYVVLGAVIALTAAVAGVVYWKRTRIEQFLRRLSEHQE